MQTTARFNFNDWKGNPLTGEVFRNYAGEYIPDSDLGMGKNYADPYEAVTDYLRRNGSTLTTYIPTTNKKAKAL